MDSSNLLHVLAKKEVVVCQAPTIRPNDGLYPHRTRLLSQTYVFFSLCISGCSVCFKLHNKNGDDVNTITDFEEEVSMRIILRERS